MWTSLFPPRAGRRVGRRARRRAATLRATRLGSWEALGLGLGGQEPLERRSMLAADLVTSFDDNIAAQVSKDYYTPGSQVVYTLVVENKGDATASGVKVTTTLSNKIDAARVSWFASYTGGATGEPGGATNVNASVNLPAGGKVVFKILGTVLATATGDLTSTADVAAVAGASNPKTDTDKFVPRSVVVADGPGFQGDSSILLADPSTGAVIAPAVRVFAADVKTGTRTAVGDLDADGKPEIVAVPGYGQTARIQVFTQNIAADGKVTLVRDTRYDILPFGAGYNRGLGLAVADFGGDGRADIAVSKTSGDGGVIIYRSTPTAASGPLAPFTSFTPFPEGNAGATIAAGDFGSFAGSKLVDAVRGDGKAELVVASGAGMTPVVKVYSVGQGTADVVRTVRPFTPSFTGGMDLAVARVNADSIPDIIVAQGLGGGSQVQVINGRVDASTSATYLKKFAAFADLATKPAGLSIAGVETGADGRAAAVVVSQLGGRGRTARGFDLATGAVKPGVGLPGSHRLAAGVSWSDTATITTASGLQITRITPPTGKTSPIDTSSVNVDYSGYLLKDGTRFDSGTGTTFKVSGVVAGFKEALKLMKVGETVKIVIPSALGYGSAGSPPKIPADADLVFYLKLNSFT